MTISKKLIECFCCHEKTLEYDEYDDVLDHCETQGQKCVTLHPDIQDNMLSESVLKIDICRYLEENWPLDDEDLERVHKLYRLVAYQRCSRWVFQILGEKQKAFFCLYLYKNTRTTSITRWTVYSF